MRTRVKICGITQSQDALAAAKLGVDAIGLVFYPPSPRAVTVVQAQEIVSVLPPFVSVVALFVNAKYTEINNILSNVSIDVVQFHGCESAPDCRRYNKPYIKAIPMHHGVDLNATMQQYSDASGILVDTFRAGTPGGTGEVFDWSMLPVKRDKPLILAGGLTPGNVAQSIERVRPYGIDVSGGVESSRGIKDVALMSALVQSVRNSYSANDIDCVSSVNW